MSGASLPVHQVDQHLRILLMLLHLHSVSKYHVQVEDQVLNLNVETGIVSKGSCRRSWSERLDLPALGKVCHAAPRPPQRTSGWSSASGGDAPR